MAHLNTHDQQNFTIATGILFDSTIKVEIPDVIARPRIKSVCFELVNSVMDLSISAC